MGSPQFFSKNLSKLVPGFSHQRIFAIFSQRSRPKDRPLPAGALPLTDLFPPTNPCAPFQESFLIPLWPPQSTAPVIPSRPHGLWSAFLEWSSGFRPIV